MIPDADWRLFPLPRQFHAVICVEKNVLHGISFIVPGVENLPPLWRQLNNLSTTFLDRVLA